MLLTKLGASITLLDPHRVYVDGPTHRSASEVICPPALRPAVVILLAMRLAKGTSVLRNVYVIHRGYEQLSERLNEIGRRSKHSRTSGNLWVESLSVARRRGTLGRPITVDQSDDPPVPGSGGISTGSSNAVRITSTIASTPLQSCCSRDLGSSRAAFTFLRKAPWMRFFAAFEIAPW